MKLVAALFTSLTLILCPCFADAKDETPKLYSKDNVLAAGCYNDGFGSSDMTLIIQLEAGGNIIFDEGAEVKYLVPEADVDGWNELEFDDSKWEDGITSVGYGDGDDNTEVPSGQVGSLYTRYQFDVPNASKLKQITFRIDYDDSYILWLNRVEIARTANIATLSPVGEVPAWDVSKVVDSMPDIEATKVPKGKPNPDRWKRPVTPKEQDVHETIHDFDIDVEFGGSSALPVEPPGKLTTIWGDLKQN